jgi:hypothetical protein
MTHSDLDDDNGYNNVPSPVLLRTPGLASKHFKIGGLYMVNPEYQGCVKYNSCWWCCSLNGFESIGIDRQSLFLALTRAKGDGGWFVIFLAQEYETGKSVEVRFRDCYTNRNVLMLVE